MREWVSSKYLKFSDCRNINFIVFLCIVIEEFWYQEIKSTLQFQII